MLKLVFIQKKELINFFWTLSVLLQTVKSEYDRILPINVALEKQIQEVQEEIERLKLEMLNETLRLKQEIEALQQEKVKQKSAKNLRKQFWKYFFISRKN